MRHMAMIASALTMGATPALAESDLGSVSGNWAGQSNEGYYFSATLHDDGGKAHLWIWQTSNPDIESSIPAFDKNDITLRNADVAGGSQRLEVVEGPDSSTLNIVTRYSDASGQVEEVVQAQFLDFQFTVVGYAITHFENGTSQSCTLDLRANTRVVDGIESQIAARGFEDDNLWYWGPNVAFERGLCPALAKP